MDWRPILPAPSRAAGPAPEVEPVAPLNSQARSSLPDSAFAYIDSKGRRRLPINDAAHVRNALARFDQTAFEDDAARERARQRLLKAALRFGITPIGFFDVQLRKERRQGEVKARAARVASLPRGLVTLLMADIEGSTRLTQQLGDGYPALLRDVWEIVRASIRPASGQEVDVRGDEFFAVFRRALDGLNAAIAIQRALARQASPAGVEVRARIGLHTGQATIADSQYVGIGVHTVARVCSAGHGGQILLSTATRHAVADSAAVGVSFRELGPYELAGLPQAEVLFQVEADGLRARFPKLRAKMSRVFPPHE
jgi:class 3 adenylate cyclase